jgi:hypothetical protein
MSDQSRSTQDEYGGCFGCGQTDVIRKAHFVTIRGPRGNGKGLSRRAYCLGCYHDAPIVDDDVIEVESL